MQLKILRTYVTNQSICSCCGTNQHMYELFARSRSQDGEIDKIQQLLICVRCDLVEQT